MDIPALSMVMAQSSLQSNVGVAVLSQSMENFEDTGEDLAKMMELSVNPGVGGNFDMSV